MTVSTYNVAVVGATGVVGQEMLKVLAERSFPAACITPVASAASAGKNVSYGNRTLSIRELTDDVFNGVHIALFSAGADISRRFAPAAAKAGAVIIDNTSAFRMDDDVPLIVPEVNPHALHDIGPRRIIANPNCSTIQMVVALFPLHQKAKIKRIVVATYQATSGAGRDAMEELKDQTHAIAEGKQVRIRALPQQIAYNCIPHIDVFMEDGFTREEVKMMRETQKIMGDDTIRVVATAVRVPVFTGHSEAVYVEFEKEISVAQARVLLASAPGVEVIDDPDTHRYPLAVTSSGHDPVFVGRIRRDPTVEHGLVLWIVADNLRKGAALNAVQIAELVCTQGLIR